MFKVNNKNTTTTSCVGVFILNFEHISQISQQKIVDLEQVNARWGKSI